jgi:Protein of unknown function (DUF2914)/Tetratricopeptide repeat
MTEHEDALQMLDRAERAAAAGDFVSAYELLQRAVRRQEEDLGPLHPDLANTLNNLAVVAERTGRVSEAEPLYRRAAAIAEAAFPPDHPMVMASRQNLEDFCRARGLSVLAPAVVTSERDTEVESNPLAPEHPEPILPPPAAPPPNPSASLSPASQPSPPAPTSERASRPVVLVAAGVVVLVVAALLMLRSGSSRDGSAPRQTAAPAAAPSPEAVASPPIPAPSTSPTRPEPGRPPNAAPRGDDRHIGTPGPAAANAVAVDTAQLCRTFSTSGRNWRCDPVGDSVAAGPIIFYTRIRSPRDGAVVHRWYREGTLRQSVRLTTRANATEGYRTYSRQTIDQGHWRVEVRSADGTLLHEQQFVVR